jgi:hypothetical protein
LNGIAFGGAKTGYEFDIAGIFALVDLFADLIGGTVNDVGKFVGHFLNVLDTFQHARLGEEYLLLVARCHYPASSIDDYSSLRLNIYYRLPLSASLFAEFAAAEMLQVDKAVC